MKPRVRDPEATKAAILEAAETVFLEKGFGNTSLSDVSRHAGITKSLIHHYFGSKEGLWQEVKTRRFLQYAETQMQMLEDSPPTADLLRDSMKTYFRFLQANPQLVRILAWMFLERDQEQCIDMDRHLVQAGVAKIREAQQGGELRSDVDARFILFMFIGMAQHWFQDREHFLHDFGTEDLPADLDTAFSEAMIRVFFEGIRPQ